MSLRCRGDADPRAVDTAIDALQLLDPLDVMPRLGERDPAALAAPEVDVVLTGVVGGEGEPLVAVLVEEVPEVPRAVADVDLGVVEVGDAEARPAGAQGNALGGARKELHQADRSGPRAGVSVELALLVDDRGEERAVEVVVARVAPDDRLVAERVPEP